MARKAQARVIYEANDSFAATVDGIDMQFNAGVTRASSEWLDLHPELRHLFDPIHVHYDVESATAAPGERRGA